MVKNRTQRLARCARLSPHRRLETERSRARMPARTTPEVLEAIRSMLLDGKTVPEVHDELRKRGVEISRGPIDKVAFSLAATGQLTRQRRVREGLSRGGRPKGEGKKWSPNREQVLALHAQGKSPREISVQVGITRQGVDRILKAQKSDPDDTEQKTN